MNKQEAITKLRGFLEWFECNMGEEEWLDTDDESEADGKWTSYLELPDYLAAREALDSLEASGASSIH